MGQLKIKRVMVQSSPRVDSVGGLYLLTRTPEGERKYPGVRDAKIEYWQTGTVSPVQGLGWQQYLNAGTLLLGVGGGPLDEHPSPQFGDRKAEGKSTMMLVAEDLGLVKHPLYRRLIQMITKADLEPVSSQLELPVIVKAMHRTGFSDQVLGFCFLAFDAMVEGQRQFLNAVDEARAVTWLPVRAPDSGAPVVGLICSDNEQIRAGVFHRYPDKRIAAVVQVRSSGRVMIFGNQKLGVSLRRVAGAIRYHELRDQGRERDANDYKDLLEVPGQMTLVPNFCYQLPGENILNGSETAPGVEPTALTAHFIHDLVCEYLVFQNQSAKE